MDFSGQMWHSDVYFTFPCLFIHRIFLVIIRRMHRLEIWMDRNHLFYVNSELHLPLFSFETRAKN